MTNDLLDTYLGWMEPQTGTLSQPRTYSDLLHLMMWKEFVWLVPNDDNRIADGLDIRREFFQKTGLKGDLDMPCSVLEVLVGLSRRLSFAAGGEAPGWTWQLICNLELHKMPDPIRRRKSILVNEILETLIWRNYAPDGQGGFFPLIDTDVDQTKIEIWYQMAAYVEEIHPEY